MKTLEIYRFELAHQLSRPAVWLSFLATQGLGFSWAMAFVDNAKKGEYFLLSPIAVSANVALMALFALLPLAALTSDAAMRDIGARMDPLLYTTPLRRRHYLLGRYLAICTLISGFMMVVVPLSLLLVRLMPGVEEAYFGPLIPLAFLHAYAFFALPTVVMGTALLYGLVLLSRFGLASYLGGIVLFFCSVFSMDLLAGHLQQWALGQLLDPSGFTVLKVLRKTLPPAHLPSQLVPLQASLLYNRLIWLGLGVGVFALASWRFQFRHHTASPWRRRRAAIMPDLAPNAPVALAIPRVAKTGGCRRQLQQVAHLSQRYFGELVLSWNSLLVPALVFILVQVVPELLEGPMGVPLMATTGNVSQAFNQFILEGSVALLLCLYAGQLVWRERDARLHDLTDTTPVPDRVLVISKLLGLCLVLLAIQGVLMLTAMGLQAGMGHAPLQIGLYLQVFFGLQLVDYLLLAVLALFTHMLVNQKYVGYLLVLLLYGYSFLPDYFGIQHKLLVYASDPGWAYSEMSGFFATLGPWLLFKLYWAGWGLLFVLLARLFWIRGREGSWQGRLQLAKRRNSRSLLLGMASAGLLIAGVGGWVFYNTNVLNSYQTAAKGAERRAEYERRYGHYRGVLQPRQTAARLEVEIYPSQRRVDIKGSYWLLNLTGQPLDTLHLATASALQTGGFQLSQAARQLLADAELGHHIFVLTHPLQPGDSLQLQFQLQYAPKGFAHTGVSKAVAKNGTLFRNNDWLPAIGYQPGRELQQAEQRRQQGLPLRAEYPSLYDAGARQAISGRERIRFEAIIGTESEQLALAPGTLRRSWMAGGRRYFHYVADSPIRNGYALLSASYALQEISWKGVQIQLYHHPDHTHNLERMLQSVQASLDHYSSIFGPYPHRQLKLVQYPGKGSLTAFPGMIIYPEDFAQLMPEADWREFDLPFAVVAHEVAHQWWGNQLVPAAVEGGMLISESLAWYSALEVVRKVQGREHLQRLLEVMQDAYLTPRSRAAVPLIRATDYFQGYRKGPFAMHALREYVGEQPINQALQRLLQAHAQGQPPLPTSLDLMGELQTATPDSLQYLLDDLFRTNTFWDLKTTQAWAEPAADGKGWQLTLEVEAHKHRVDSIGQEQEVPVNDWVEIGVYAKRSADSPAKQLYLQAHKLRSGKQQLQLLLPEKPGRAGIDTRFLLLDTDMMDNLMDVTNGRPLMLSAAGE